MTQKEKIHELLDIVLEGNGITERQRDKTGTLPTLFFRYSGHINKIEIDLHSDGWTAGAWADRNWNINADDPISESSIESLREAVKEALANGSEVDVLRRDIERAEDELTRKKEAISAMKKKLKKMEKQS